MGGVSISILFVFLGYIFTRKPKKDIIPDIKKYEQRFEEEYREFISEFDEPNADPSFKDNSSKKEEM